MFLRSRSTRSDNDLCEEDGGEGEREHEEAEVTEQRLPTGEVQEGLVEVNAVRAKAVATGRGKERRYSSARRILVMSMSSPQEETNTITLAVQQSRRTNCMFF